MANLRSQALQLQLAHEGEQRQRQVRLGKGGGGGVEKPQGGVWWRHAGVRAWLEGSEGVKGREGRARKGEEGGGKVCV